MGVSFESPDLRRLAVDFDEAAGVAPEESRKVVQRGAFNIKADARQRRAGSRHFPRLASAITYDSGQTPTGSWAEVGPDIERPGLMPAAEELPDDLKVTHYEAPDVDLSPD